MRINHFCLEIDRKKITIKIQISITIPFVLLIIFDKDILYEVINKELFIFPNNYLFIIWHLPLAKKSGIYSTNSNINSIAGLKWKSQRMEFFHFPKIFHIFVVLKYFTVFHNEYFFRYLCFSTDNILRKMRLSKVTSNHFPFLWTFAWTALLQWTCTSTMNSRIFTNLLDACLFFHVRLFTCSQHVAKHVLVRFPWNMKSYFLKLLLND